MSAPEGPVISRLDRTLIAGLSPFAGLSPADLDSVVGRANPLRLSEGQAVFRQGASAESFYLLLDGYVRVVKTTPGGQDVIMRYIQPGELLGIAHALGRDTYPATAFAAIDCVLLSWPGHLWAEFVQSHPSFGASALRTVGNRLQDAHDRNVELVTEQVTARVARTLVRLADQAGRKTGGGLLIGFPISRQEIGEIAGTTLHTVSRLLAAWEDKGLISSRRREVTVIDRNGLLAIAGSER